MTTRELAQYLTTLNSRLRKICRALDDMGPALDALAPAGEEIRMTIASTYRDLLSETRRLQQVILKVQRRP